jgi:antitoxin MazE
MTMETHIRRWGNSLAVRIPKAFAQQAGLQENAPITLSLVGGRLLIEPVLVVGFTLDELLADVTEQNVHAEVETGPAVGNEVW